MKNCMKIPLGRGAGKNMKLTDEYVVRKKYLYCFYIIVQKLIEMLYGIEHRRCINLCSDTYTLPKILLVGGSVNNTCHAGFEAFVVLQQRLCP